MAVLTWCLVSLLTASQVQLESSYSRSIKTVKLGSSFEFSWNYTGNLRCVEWGTKCGEINALNVTLFVLGISGRLIPNIPKYNGRRFGSWNQKSPGQVKFTLNPIKEVDNQVFIFRFVPVDPFAPTIFDVAQLIVRGKNFYYSMNCCFIMEGSINFLEWASYAIEFQQFWNAHCKQKSVVMKSDVVALPLREPSQQFPPYVVWVIGKFKCMKTLSLVQRKMCD